MTSLPTPRPDTLPDPAPEPPEVEVVEKTRISCDGGGGALGHPLVWYTIDPGIGFVECGYCDKRFELAKPGKA